MEGVVARWGLASVPRGKGRQQGSQMGEHGLASKKTTKETSAKGEQRSGRSNARGSKEDSSELYILKVCGRGAKGARVHLERIETSPLPVA